MRLALSCSLMALAIGAASAQAPQPAQLGLTVTGAPNVLQVLDSTRTWVPVGFLSPTTHTFASAGLRQVINVTQPPWSADPTGANDSTAALNTALSLSGGPSANSGGPCVYMPAGTYFVSDQLSMQPHDACLFGDNPLSTTIMAYGGGASSTHANFNQVCPIPYASEPAPFPPTGCAYGVLVLPPNSGGDGDVVRDIGFDFTQPQQSVRANIVNFPPAIRILDSGRHRIANIRVGDANICLDARASAAPGMGPLGDYAVSGGGGVFLDNMECGALTAGMLWDGAKDYVQWTNFHFWAFGNQISGGHPLNAVFADGNTICISNGRIDGLLASNTACFNGNHIETVNASAVASGIVQDQVFSGHGLDNSSQLEIAGGTINITGGHFSGPVFGPNVSVTGGVLQMSKFRFPGGTNAYPLIQVSGSGKAYITNSTLVANSASVQGATVSGGFLDLDGDTLFSSAARTTPWVEQSGTGGLMFVGNTFFSPANGVGVQYDVDANDNLFGSNNIMLGWTVNYPSGAITKGRYALASGPGWVAPSWTLQNPSGVSNLFSNSADGSASFLSVQDAGVTKWRVGNTGSATSDHFAVRDIANGSTDFLNVGSGGSPAAYGEAAGNVHTFRGVIQGYLGDRPTASGTCAVTGQTGGQMSGQFTANGACASGGTVILTFAAAVSTAFVCDAHDWTTPADAINQTASTTTSVTFTAANGIAASDVVAWKCTGS